MSEAARLARALRKHAWRVDVGVIFDWAECDVLAEDAVLAAQADTPEAHAAKERWVRTIFRKEMAEVLRLWASDFRKERTADGIVVMERVADKLDPPPAPKPQMIADRPEDLDHAVRIDEPPPRPGDQCVFVPEDHPFTVAAVVRKAVLDTNGVVYHVASVKCVALAKIKPGMAVEVLDRDGIVCFEALCCKRDGEHYLVFFQRDGKDAWEWYRRHQLRLIKAPEGKA